MSNYEEIKEHIEEKKAHEEEIQHNHPRTRSGSLLAGSSSSGRPTESTRTQSLLSNMAAGAPRELIDEAQDEFLRYWEEEQRKKKNTENTLDK